MANHFYTLNPLLERPYASGYEYEGTACHVYPGEHPDTEPLYRLYHELSGNHFYTMNLAEAQHVMIHGDYKAEGPVCYIYAQPTTGTVPLFRIYNPTAGDHFYTQSLEETKNAIESAGCLFEGIVGYVFATEQEGTGRFSRWYQSGLMSKFIFDEGITEAQKDKVLERHSWAFYHVMRCTELNDVEKQDLRNKYMDPVQHSILVSDNPSENGRGVIDSNHLWINFDGLFPDGDVEISKTAIHETMHCAGYSHRARIDFPNEGYDTPGDGGEYFGSAPLKTELCIALALEAGANPSL